jgi:molybdate transport system substrate-binding protein
VVLAAASLTESFTRIGEDFERTNPEVEVTFSFGASSTLATQVTQGVPADVFAAANESSMATAISSGAAQDPQPFGSNTLQIAVPPGNPGRISGLRDFADANQTIALCAPQVPCGAAADRVFAAAGITARPDTLEQDVKAALQKVQLGEVDAALVYRTDIIAAGDRVAGIAFGEAAQAVNIYPIAVLSEAPNAAAARAFVDYVLAAEGQAVLRAAGFGQPA